MLELSTHLLELDLHVGLELPKIPRSQSLTGPSSKQLDHPLLVVNDPSHLKRLIERASDTAFAMATAPTPRHVHRTSLAPQAEAAHEELVHRDPRLAP